MTNTFYFEDGMDNLFDEHDERVYNELLNIMDKDGSLKDSYLVMDNASIHKSKLMIRN